MIPLQSPGAYVIPAFFQASSDPNLATAQTVGRMTGIIRSTCYHPAVIRAASTAIADAQDPRVKAERIFAWVKAKLNFNQDEEQLRKLFGKDDALELLIEPPLLLAAVNPQGDCDDYTMLVCAMLLACGIPCRICTVAADRSRPDQFSHVYAIALCPERLPLDASHGPRPGWEAEQVFRRQEWPVPPPDMPKPVLHGLVRYPTRRGMGEEEESSSSGFNWNALIDRGFQFGENLFALNRQGSIARPGSSVNQPYNLRLPTVTGGISTTTLLVGGAAVLAVVLLSGRR